MSVVTNNPPLLYTVAGIAALFHGAVLWVLVFSEPVKPVAPMAGESFEMVVLNSEKRQTMQSTSKSVTAPKEVEPLTLSKTPQPLPGLVVKDTARPEGKSVVTAEPPPSKQIVRVEEEVLSSEPDLVAKELPIREENPVDTQEASPLEEFVNTDEALSETVTEQTKMVEHSPGTSSTESKKFRSQPRSDAAYLNNTEPTYPVSARRRRLEGLVLLEVTVDPEGYPSLVDVKKSSGHQVLDDAARGAVEEWRFVPAEEGGLMIAAKVDVPIRFSLK